MRLSKFSSHEKRTDHLGYEQLLPYRPRCGALTSLRSLHRFPKNEPMEAITLQCAVETSEESRSSTPSTGRELGSLDFKISTIILEHADRTGKHPSSSQDRAIFRKPRAKGHMAFFLEIGHPSQHPWAPMKYTSPLCSLCNASIEDDFHLIVDCKFKRVSWMRALRELELLNRFPTLMQVWQFLLLSDPRRNLETPLEMRYWWQPMVVRGVPVYRTLSTFRPRSELP
ncbi:hypothetical protein INT44_005720 [Umbelopsis vinacea]|uniref:Reverse transcriptase zinc-binding domain-containing protein n=1 Tax=Umbelopsis vinacea TaxID=44442 RepID=A0A8H7PZH1_9FUNG|nr:hypothetical protein INT44_005720 [Umbelopsis vinacea]